VNPTEEEMESLLEVDTHTEYNPHDKRNPIMVSKFTGQMVISPGTPKQPKTGL